MIEASERGVAFEVVLYCRSVRHQSVLDGGSKEQASSPRWISTQQGRKYVKRFGVKACELWSFHFISFLQPFLLFSRLVGVDWSSGTGDIDCSVKDGVGLITGAGGI